MKQIEQELFPALGIQSKLLQSPSKLGKKKARALAIQTPFDMLHYPSDVCRDQRRAKSS